MIKYREGRVIYFTCFLGISPSNRRPLLVDKPSEEDHERAKQLDCLRDEVKSTGKGVELRASREMEAVRD